MRWTPNALKRLEEITSIIRNSVEEIAMMRATWLGKKAADVDDVKQAIKAWELLIS